MKWRDRWFKIILVLLAMASTYSYFKRHQDLGRKKVDPNQKHFADFMKEKYQKELAGGGPKTSPTPYAVTSEVTTPKENLKLTVDNTSPHHKAREVSPTRAPKETYADLLTTSGLITIKLLISKAPKTVNNFLKYSEDKPFYDGLQFFRAVPEYFIQTGDESNTGKSNLGFLDFDETNIDPYDIEAGMVIMAKLGKATSKTQFFIALRNMTKVLEGRQTVFGIVHDLTVVREISKVKTDIFDMPLTPVTIKEVKIRKLYDKKETKR